MFEHPDMFLIFSLIYLNVAVQLNSDPELCSTALNRDTPYRDEYTRLGFFYIFFLLDEEEMHTCTYLPV